MTAMPPHVIIMLLLSKASRHVVAMFLVAMIATKSSSASELSSRLMLEDSSETDFIKSCEINLYKESVSLVDYTSFIHAYCPSVYCNDTTALPLTLEIDFRKAVCSYQNDNIENLIVSCIYNIMLQAAEDSTASSIVLSQDQNSNTSLFNATITSLCLHVYADSDATCHPSNNSTATLTAAPTKTPVKRTTNPTAAPSSAKEGPTKTYAYQNNTEPSYKSTQPTAKAPSPKQAPSATPHNTSTILTTASPTSSTNTRPAAANKENTTSSTKTSHPITRTSPAKVPSNTPYNITSPSFISATLGSTAASPSPSNDITFSTDTKQTTKAPPGDRGGKNDSFRELPVNETRHKDTITITFSILAGVFATVLLLLVRRKLSPSTRRLSLDNASLDHLTTCDGENRLPSTPNSPILGRTPNTTVHKSPLGKIRSPKQQQIGYEKNSASNAMLQLLDSCSGSVVSSISEDQINYLETLIDDDDWMPVVAAPMERYDNNTSAPRMLLNMASFDADVIGKYIEEGNYEDLAIIANELKTQNNRLADIDYGDVSIASSCPEAEGEEAEDANIDKYLEAGYWNNLAATVREQSINIQTDDDATSSTSVNSTKMGPPQNPSYNVGLEDMDRFFQDENWDALAEITRELNLSINSEVDDTMSSATPARSKLMPEIDSYLFNDSEITDLDSIVAMIDNHHKKAASLQSFHLNNGFQSISENSKSATKRYHNKAKPDVGSTSLVIDDIEIDAIPSFDSVC